MAKIVWQGRLSHKARSTWVLLKTSADVLWRRARGKPLVPAWSASFEIGTLFYRQQFNHAFALESMEEARAYFDSLYTVLRDKFEIEVCPSGADEPRGHWFLPHGQPAGDGTPTLLYLHGGGYAFYASVSRHFMSMLAQALQMPLFAPDYRLTPEYPHPAQLEDAVTAYRYLLSKGIPPSRIVICGDSAGGHLGLMTIAKLRDAGLPQPALGIGLSPWTDTGLRGASQFGNDVYDLVQGYQTVKFSEWLKAGTAFSDREISPIYQDYRGAAPIYLQAGGKEILVDMIRDFARELRQQGAAVVLDVWPHMTHEFHAYGDDLPESKEAIERLKAAIAWSQGHANSSLEPIAVTELALDN
ncbi:alpha/beta hydrolase [Ottowia testudinis]|uniref:Alpha/beta hydrolase n=1 Tax=Ottowia testudinis TaxID=2816950 RepID=A0A975CI90_9BURK|nr:alpha/beta hydrolase [Ottowia testudinis]QTD46257.1 alpha/beta hydrolase [Ottowia testudinis]